MRVDVAVGAIVAQRGNWHVVLVSTQSGARLFEDKPAVGNSASGLLGARLAVRTCPELTPALAIAKVKFRASESAKRMSASGRLPPLTRPENGRPPPRPSKHLGRLCQKWRRDERLTGHHAHRRPPRSKAAGARGGREPGQRVIAADRPAAACRSCLAGAGMRPPCPRHCRCRQQISPCEQEICLPEQHSCPVQRQICVCATEISPSGQQISPSEGHRCPGSTQHCPSEREICPTKRKGCRLPGQLALGGACQDFCV